MYGAGGRVLLALLIACAGHFSPPWCHDHADLTSEELADHLRCHHVGGAGSEIPEGSHAHFWDSILEKCVRSSSGPSMSGAFDVLHRLTNASFVAAFQSSVPGTAFASLLEENDRDALLSADACRKQQAYSRLNVLLI